MLLFVTLLVFCAGARAFWRMPCDLLTEERLDPLISPGKVSGHVHGIFGASNFGKDLPSFDTLQKSTCTSCHVTQDRSAYWTPSLYFHHKNGSFLHVESNGILAYYLPRGNEKKILAFPKGLHAIAGNPTKRSNTGTPAQKLNSISFNCLGTNKPETEAIPHYDCPGGLRAQVFFPSCGDGRSDSPDHSSHLAYPSGGSGNGNCPKSHPVRYVSLFIERQFDTPKFDRQQGMDPSQPFVFAYGDPTGYGYHADFINGWSSPEFLQKAIDTCTSDSGTIEACKLFTIVNSDCHKSATVNEIVKDQPLKALPGCNPIQNGPKDASMGMCATQPTTFPHPVAYTGDVPPPGTKVVGNQPSTVVKLGNYRFKGCYSDVQWVRVLKTQLEVQGEMTVNKCLAACEAKKLPYCGVEFASECYGDTKLDAASKPLGIAQCASPCKGNSRQYCGGGLALSLYTRQAATTKTKRHMTVLRSPEWSVFLDA